jgi:hypothetical protein
MPIPKPNKDESNKDFMSRCMSNPTMNKEYPSNGQRYTICTNQTKSSLLEKACDILADRIKEEDEEEELTEDNLVIPNDDDYEECDEPSEDYNLESLSKFEYKHPVTNEIYTYDRKGVYEKDGRTLLYVGKAAKYQGRTVKLNKPFRTPDGPKKFSVYVKNDKGNVVKVNFGDPNMKIKKNIPERRKSFRARHNCDNPGPKHKARYWSCQWSW